VSAWQAAPCCWRSRYRHLSEISSPNGVREATMRR
jgi:hypothetical protein